MKNIFMENMNELLYREGIFSEHEAGLVLITTFLAIYSSALCPAS